MIEICRNRGLIIIIETTDMEEKKELTLPKSIVIASVLIGGAMIIAPVIQQSYKMSQCVSALSDGQASSQFRTICLQYLN